MNQPEGLASLPTASKILEFSLVMGTPSKLKEYSQIMEFKPNQNQRNTVLFSEILNN